MESMALHARQELAAEQPSKPIPTMLERPRIRGRLRSDRNPALRELFEYQSGRTGVESRRSASGSLFGSEAVVVSVEAAGAGLKSSFFS